MRERIGTTEVSDEALHAFFDGELSGPEAEAVQRAIDDDPELREEFEQLGLVSGLVTHGLAREANRVSQARFEQIWDQIDRAIDQEVGVRAPAEGGSIWSRLWAAVRPLRWPAVAAAAAAAITVVVVQGGPSDPNNSPQVAVQDPAPPAPSPEAKAPAPAPAKDDMLALEKKDAPPTDEPEAELQPMPVPQSAAVEIHNIEFGGRSGRISSSGTMTVLYVEEEVGSADSERSL